MNSFYTRIKSSYFLKIGLVFIAYFLTAKLGLKMDAVSCFAALVWPPTGIALATILLGGYRLWPAIALGAFWINFTSGASLSAAFGIAFGNTLEAFAGAYLLHHFVGFHNSMDRLKDAISF